MLCKNDVLNKADKLNKMAAKLLPLPEGMTLPEQWLYKSLCIVYQDYRGNKLTTEQAKSEKKKLYKAYLDAAYKLDLWNTYAEIVNVYHHHQDEIRKNGCEVCRKLDGILCGLFKED